MLFFDGRCIKIISIIALLSDVKNIYWILKNYSISRILHYIGAKLVDEMIWIISTVHI